MKYSLVVLAAALAAAPSRAQDAEILYGTAQIEFDLPTLLGQTPLDQFDAVFGIRETRSDLLYADGNSPGPIATWTLNWPGIASPSGRTIQPSTLKFNKANLLGTWGTGTDLGAFLSGGEQIGFGGITRFELDPDYAGILLFGDWGLRYSPSRHDATRSGLVLTSNIDFANAVFADVGQLTTSVVGSTLTITGHLLISDGLILLGFPDENYLLDIGELTITARIGRADVNTDGLVTQADLAAWDQGSGWRDVDLNGVIDADDRALLVATLRARRLEIARPQN